MIPCFQIMPQEADNWEAEYQLNNYRIKIEAKFPGFEISKLQVQVLVRDGGLQVARQRGITRRSMLIPVKIMDNDEVLSYFDRKKHDLDFALETMQWTTPCSAAECWDGVRCRDYCEVAMYCPKGILETGGKY